MKLVVQMPALNEEKTIASVIGGIPKDIPGADSVEVVVVDDGSTDRTGEIARSAGAHVVRHERPRGVGLAFRSGLERSSELGADIIVTIDSDGQFDPRDIPKLVEPIANGEADFVTASRFADPALAPEMPAAKRWGNDMIARWLSAAVGRRFYDVSCGFRAYSRNAYMRLVLLGDFTYTHEVFLNLAFCRVPIMEIPIKIRGVREFGRSRVANNLFRYAWRTASIILRTYRDYRPMRFFGYMSAGLFALAAWFGAFAMSVKINTGIFTPHKWAAVLALALIGASLLVLLVGMVAEMLDRIRVAQDELIFRVRRLELSLKHKPGSPGGPG
jgi:glycosyltransferase involved in cell wall biosynthesis